MQELLAQYPGTGDMPTLPFFLGGDHELPLVISFDATGFGTQQLNTISVRNPYLSASATLLRTFGLGNCSDDRVGTTSLLGPNLPFINKLISLKDMADAKARCIECEVNGEKISVAPRVFVVTDVSALRHTEHLAASGWCACSRDFALRRTPTVKPTTVP